MHLPPHFTHVVIRYHWTGNSACGLLWITQGSHRNEMDALLKALDCAGAVSSDHATCMALTKFASELFRGTIQIAVTECFRFFCSG
jgi:hypothetical protein